MATRGSNVAGVLSRATRDKAMPPLVIVSSDEALLALEAQDALRAKARELGYTEREVLNADARWDWSKLAQATQDLSLFAERRIVELRLPTGKPGIPGGAALEALAHNPPADTLTLVALPKLDRRTRDARWASALAQHGTWLDIDAIERAQLPQWIAARLARQQQSADDEALAFIADRVEGNLLAAHQEILKLGLLHPPGKLTLQQVHDAVLDVARFDVFQLPAAIVAGDRARIAKSMAGLQAEGEPLPLVLWVISEELRTMARAQSQAAAGRPFAQIARENRLWGREALYERALQQLDETRLAAALARVADVDRLAKGLRAAARDSDPWLELTDLALQISPSGSA